MTNNSEGAPERPRPVPVNLAARATPAAADAAAEQTKLSPGQAVVEKLLAIRNALVAHNDKIATVLLSIHGSDKPLPARAPANDGTEYRRFFPAAVRLNAEIDAEVKRLGELAEQLDRAF